MVTSMSRCALVRASRQSIQLFGAFDVLQRHEAMRASPTQLRDLLGVRVLGSEDARGESVLHGLLEEGVRVLLRIVLRELSRPSSTSAA